MESNQNSEELLRMRKNFVKHLLADWGLRIISSIFWIWTKRGPTPRPKWSWKLLKRIVTIRTSNRPIAHWLPHHNIRTSATSLNLPKNHHRSNFLKLASNGVGQCKIHRFTVFTYKNIAKSNEKIANHVCSIQTHHAHWLPNTNWATFFSQLHWKQERNH